MSQEVTNAAPQEQQAQNVTTIAQAIQVLLQAVEIGRAKGIYDWGDAAVIGQAIGLIKEATKPPAAPQEDAAPQEVSDVATEVK